MLLHKKNSHLISIILIINIPYTVIDKKYIVFKFIINKLKNKNMILQPGLAVIIIIKQKKI